MRTAPETPAGAVPARDRSGTRVLGIDCGGTFTDVVVDTPSGLVSRKVPSTPDDPAKAVLAAVDAAGGLPEGGRVHHGTTVATNTVLTRSGARVALVTTAGFEDLLHVGRGHRTDLFDTHPRRIEPLVRREDVLGLAARVDAAGKTLRAPTASDLRRLARAARERGVDAIAVCLLHATVAPAHEEKVRGALAPSRLPCHASHRVSADAREVERAEATVLDAYVGPRIRTYVERVARGLPEGALSVLRSDGTRMEAADAASAPGRTLLSGPAAGAAAAHALAKHLGLERVLTFDVGGTSTDVAWIEGAELPVTLDRTLDGFSMGVPSLDVHSVGAGGGSIVVLDAGGALRVGPESAGAEPGPACYGRGGPFTLTDAHLLLARLPEALLGGAFPLDEDAAYRAGEALARRTKLSLSALCLGAIRVAETTTTRALRVASASAGRDPRGAYLIAFGGAGGLLADAVASALGLSASVIPWSPGTFAAQGARLAPRSIDASRAVHGKSDRELDRISRHLEEETRVELARGGEEVVATTLEVDARYEGQGSEISAAFRPGWRFAFHAAHAARRGWRDDERPVRAVRLRARAFGPALSFVTPKPPAGDVSRTPAPSGIRRGLAGPVPMHRREDLASGAQVEGPALVVEDGATTWVPEGARLSASPDGTLRLHHESPR